MKVNFGTRLKRLLAEKEIQQIKMSKDLNVAPATISGYVTNAHQPAIDMLVTIAEYLDVSLEELVGYSVRTADSDKKEKINELIECASAISSEDLELLLMLARRLDRNGEK